MPTTPPWRLQTGHEVIGPPKMNSDLCCTTGQHRIQSVLSELRCGLGLLMHITARGTSPSALIILEWVTCSGFSWDRGQAIWPMGLIAQRELGVCIRGTMTVEHTTQSSLNSQIIAQSCTRIICKGTTIFAKIIQELACMMVLELV